uniref:Uncharacterized protein n=1 Tax=viral metagenome TaxID=1070528 RepID=A0A6M3LN84_9ZZZZ
MIKEIGVSDKEKAYIQPFVENQRLAYKGFRVALQNIDDADKLLWEEIRKVYPQVPADVKMSKPSLNHGETEPWTIVYFEE